MAQWVKNALVLSLMQEAQETVGSIPGSGKSPGEANVNPFQYSCLENSMDRGSGQLQSMGSQSDFHFHTSFHQYSFFFSVC